MRICVAQTRAIKGDIQANIEHHKKVIDMAVSRGADTIIFPELSITGYEPELAKDLATHPEDRRFDDFQNISDIKQITIGIGVPTQANAGVCISMILFQPHQARQTYSKQYLHADEEPFFVRGQLTPILIGNKPDIALAICYEISVPEHAEQAFRNGAKMYIASVAKSADGVEKAVSRLSEIASTYAIPVLMSNCVGYCDNFESAGTSSIWNSQGILVGQLNDTNEGMLIIDTNTQAIVEKML
jgi:predicted amidohydrolase